MTNKRGGFDQGREPGSGCGHGRSPGHGKASGHRGHRGRGRGRANEAIHRFENSSGSSGGSKQVGDFTPGRADSSQLAKQSSLSGLHDLLVGPHGISRGYIPSASGNATRRGQLSWADMRRRSQRSNSTTDDSSEPDRSYRSFPNVGGSDGGWGGRGRGRLLDTSSVKKSGHNVGNVGTSFFGGRGRGGILHVPGVSFHSGFGSTGWKIIGTSDQGRLSSRYSVGGCATNSAVQSSQSFQRKVGVTGPSSNWQQNKKSQIWKKKAVCKENNNGAKIDNLQPVGSPGTGDSDTQSSFIPCTQRKDQESITNIESTDEKPLDGSETVTDVNKQVIDIISLAEGNGEKLVHQGKHSDVNNIEEHLQKQLIIETDTNMQKPVVPVICSAEQNSDGREKGKPVHCSPRGGHSRGLVLVGASTVTDGGTADTQSAVMCERGIEEKPSDTQIILKPENNCNDKICGAVV